MTSHTEDKSPVRRPETGWARSRRLRSSKNALRTWVPAVAGPDTAPGTRRGGPESNIVRGED